MAAETSGSGSSGDKFIGCLVHLISKSEIRYEGIVYYINPDEPSIGLRNVRSFGTEGRKKDGPQVPPSERVYEYILFRASDIKDLVVKSAPPVQTAPIQNDPPIIKPHYSPMDPASTPGSGTISDQSSQTAQLGHPSSTFQGGLPLYQAGKNIESWGSTRPVTKGSGLGLPMYWQGFYAPTSGISNLQQTPLLRAPPGLSIPHSLPQHAQFSTINSLFPSGTLSLHEAAAPLPPPVGSTSTSVSTSVQHPNTNSLFATTTPSLPEFFSPLTPPASWTPSLIASLPSSVATTQASSLAAEPSLNLLPNRPLLSSHPASLFHLNIPSVPLLGSINAPGPSVPNTSILSSPSTESAPYFPFQTISQSMKDPILPLPKPAHRKPNEAASYAYFNSSRRHGRGRGTAFSEPVTSFTEDFDFMAMNEKFNKAEVWGQLGKGKELPKYDEREGQSSHVNAIREEDEESLNLENKPVYRKDDFFDEISYNKPELGTHSGRARFSELLKDDMETSGDFPRHRSNRGGGRGFRGGNRGRWRGSNYDRGKGSNTRGHGHV